MECCLSCENMMCSSADVECMILSPAPVISDGKCSFYVGKDYLKYRLQGGHSRNALYFCKLRDLRLLRGLTQNDLAFYVGTSQNTISSLENGVYRPNIELAWKIGQFFEMDPFEIFCFH